MLREFEKATGVGKIFSKHISDNRFISKKYRRNFKNITIQLENGQMI
jgi:hypothetical protein